MSASSCLFDVAGASIGGAARFLRELDVWVSRHSIGSDLVQVVGRGRRLTPSWLIEREFLGKGVGTRIALNNASFMAPQSCRVVLLRNALHFAREAEFEELKFQPSVHLRAQIPVIRALARRADWIVVPCHAMAERVHSIAPYLGDRLIVRGHPVSRIALGSQPANGRPTILVPIVPAPYKNLDRHVRDLLEAVRGVDVRVVVTATPDQLPEAARHRQIEFIGRLSAAQLQVHWEKAQAIYYPTGLEAFGYPLAEARVAGRWVIAQKTDQNSEIAGGSLQGYSLGDLESLGRAVARSMVENPVVDSAPNDPDCYFTWLTGLGSR